MVCIYIGNRIKKKNNFIPKHTEAEPKSNPILIKKEWCHGIYLFIHPNSGDKIIMVFFYFTIQFFVVVKETIPIPAGTVIPAGMAIPSFRHSVIRRFVSSLSYFLTNRNFTN